MSRKASSSDPASMSGSNSAKILRVCLLTATYLWKSTHHCNTGTLSVDNIWHKICKWPACNVRSPIGISSSKTGTNFR
jgi:hypothetical protein